MFGKRIVAAGGVFARSLLGPAEVMCLVACATVLALAGYRTDTTPATPGLDSTLLVSAEVLATVLLDGGDPISTDEAKCSEPGVAGLSHQDDPPVFAWLGAFEAAELLDDGLCLGGETAGPPIPGDWKPEKPKRPINDNDADVDAAFDAELEPLFELQLASVASIDDLRQRLRELHTVSYLREVVHQIRPGETLSKLLRANGVGVQETRSWVDAADGVYDLDHVYEGQSLSLKIDERSRRLHALALEIDLATMLIAERTAGGVNARREPIAYERNTRVVSGTVEESLAERDVPETVVSQVAEILGWELDFARDLRPGATFKIAYEEMVRPSSRAKRAGRVLAVELVNRGRRYEAFYHASSNGRYEGYYDRNGRALGRRFLRYPVSYSRISSRFSESRFHPVLKVPRPHYGVDFAAPAGTPVRAIAAGRVSKSGWYGGSGRFVKLSHEGAYESGYAHLSRIASGIERGALVEKGQVIGYVGSTGLATGPHLHFALYKGGRYVDPLSVELPQAKSLRKRRLGELRATIASIEAAYARAVYATAPERHAPIVTASARGSLAGD
jgi:murein DD-endopeptidase MepM/ murein hydrolase activator NlpD